MNIFHDINGKFESSTKDYPRMMYYVKIYKISGKFTIGMQALLRICVKYRSINTIRFLPFSHQINLE